MHSCEEVACMQQWEGADSINTSFVRMVQSLDIVPVVQRFLQATNK